MKIVFNTDSMADYRTFIRMKSLPQYWFQGRQAVVPDQYAYLLTGERIASNQLPYERSEYLFDYQGDIAEMAIREQKYAVFAACGLGKTAIQLEITRHVLKCVPKDRCVLAVAPLMVVEQTRDESMRFYGDAPKQIAASELQDWLNDPRQERFGITNYEAIREGLEPGRLAGLLNDESSVMKNSYGAWGTRLIDLGKGLDWKFCFTGTPAPNDPIEYANHAVFLDKKRTVNEFLARYFINKGQTQGRWELRGHAKHAFYRDLSHWCIFLSNPAVYGWKDNCGTIPPIQTHIHHVELTDDQRSKAQKMTGQMFVNEIGGIGQRSKLAQLAKGKGAESNKAEFIRNLINSWPEESTIIWCIHNDEQEIMERTFPNAASIKGTTPYEERVRLLKEFKSGQRKQLISKGKVLGFGQNLQIATRQVFSGINDSWEMYHQCVKRSNRIGSKYPLNVHIPVTELEDPMIQNVLRKAHRVEEEEQEQERMFLDKLKELRA